MTDSALKIVVCIKNVSHVYAPASFDRKSEKIDSDCVVNIMNPFDEYAFEMALHMKRMGGPRCRVAVLSFGEENCKEMLSYCLSSGADEAYLVREDDFPPLDPWSRALVLSHGVRKMGFDVVLCGKQAIDDNFGLVGGYLAHFLNIPWLSNVISVEEFNQQDQRLICRRRADKTKIERIKAPGPVMLIADKSGVELSYPSLRGIFNSRQKKITEWKGADLGLEPHRLTGEKLIHDVRTIPPKPKPMFTVDSNLSAADRMKMIMGGGLAKKSDTKILEGKKEDVLPKVVRFLIDNIL